MIENIIILNEKMILLEGGWFYLKECPIVIQIFLGNKIFIYSKFLSLIVVYKAQYELKMIMMVVKSDWLFT